MKHFLPLLIACLFTANMAVQAQTVSTFAGTLSYPDYIDGTGIAAGFRYPCGVAVDGSGNIYVADRGNKAIRKITPAGVVSTLASGFEGYPWAVAVDASGTVYVTDTEQHMIKKVSPAGVVTTLAGSGAIGSTDATGTAASFNEPRGVAVDASGNVYVADANNNLIRKITSAGVVTTLAGSGSSGSADGTGTAASFKRPSGIALGGDGNLYVSDFDGNKIRKVTPAGEVTTFAGHGDSGDADGTGTSAYFKNPLGLAFDAGGNLYVADFSNHRIRRITPAGVVTTLAGGSGFGVAGFADGIGTDAGFNYPCGVAFDASGILYVADSINQTIRKIVGGVLPVTLIDFTAKADGNYAKLQWQTASEVNNKGFEIWRGAESERQKAESTTFVKIGEVSASHISNLASQIYNYTDKSPLNGNNYYKLVQVDNDGKATEQGIKTVTFNFQPSTFNLYPNPATHNITLNLGDKKGTLTISDALGRAKTTLGYHASALTIDISAYPSGVYFYQLGNIQGKFIKQ